MCYHTYWSREVQPTHSPTRTDCVIAEGVLSKGCVQVLLLRFFFVFLFFVLAAAQHIAHHAACFCCFATMLLAMAQLQYIV